MATNRKIRIALAAAVGLLPMTAFQSAVPANAGFGRGPDLGAAAGATAKYHRPEVAARDGYALPPDTVGSGLLSKCVNNPHFPAMPGAMGFHWINFGLIDGVLDPAHPEVLIYEPRKNGKLRLVGMEYVVFESAAPEAPELFDRTLSLVPTVDEDGEPNRYGLPGFYQVHVWLWKHNPHGLFADHNPRVSCEHADVAGQ